MFTLIIEQFGDPCLKIITVAAIASLVVGVIKDGWATGWMEGVAHYYFNIILIVLNCLLVYDLHCDIDNCFSDINERLFKGEIIPEIECEARIKECDG